MKDVSESMFAQQIEFEEFFTWELLINPLRLENQIFLWYSQYVPEREKNYIYTVLNTRTFDCFEVYELFSDVKIRLAQMMKEFSVIPRDRLQFYKLAGLLKSLKKIANEFEPIEMLEPVGR